MSSKQLKIIGLFDQAVVSGSNFVLGVLLARWLGLDHYGVYTLAWMVVLFALSINQACVTKPMLTISGKEQNTNVYLSTVHLLQICFVTGVVLLSGLIAQIGYWWEIELFDFSWIPLLCLLIGTFLLHDFYRKYFFSQKKLIAALCLDCILYGGQLIALIVLFYLEILTLQTVFISLLIVSIISCIVGFILSTHRQFNWNELPVVFNRHFDFSKWLLGTAVLQWLSGNFFIIVSAGVLGPIAVGAVRIAQNIMGLCHIFFQVMENIVPVEAAQQYASGGMNSLKKYLQSISIQMGVLIVGLLSLISIFATFLLDVLYGAAYVPYAYIIWGFCVMYLLVYAGYPLRFALRTLEVTKPIFIGYLLSTLFSILFAKWMISKWEIQGLILGMAICQVLSLLAYWYYLKPLLSKKQSQFVSSTA